MNVKSVVENKEKFEVELTIEVGQEEFEAGLDKAYRKNRGSISVPGFRKGKAPRKVIEGMYGAGVFYEDAIEEIYPQACMQAIEEKGLDSVAPPRVEITDLGKEGFTFKAIVTVRPVITLKQYKGLEADKVLPTVTEAAVDNELKQYVDRVVTVSDDEIASAVLLLLERCKQVVETSGAAPLAAVLNNKVDVRGKKVVCVLSGGNIDVSFIHKIVEKGLITRCRQLKFSVLMPDAPGALEHFSHIVAQQNANIILFQHDRVQTDLEIGEAIIHVVCEVGGVDHAKRLIDTLTDDGYKVFTSQI